MIVRCLRFVVEPFCPQRIVAYQHSNSLLELPADDSPFHRRPGAAYIMHWSSWVVSVRRVLVVCFVAWLDFVRAFCCGDTDSFGCDLRGGFEYARMIVTVIRCL